MVGIPTIMEGTITIMGDTQIATEAIQVMAMEDTQTIIMVGTQIITEVIQTIMEDIQVMVMGVTQAMVMEDIQTTIKITGTLETVSELLEATKSKIRRSHSEHNQFQYKRSVSAQAYVKVNSEIKININE